LRLSDWIFRSRGETFEAVVNLVAAVAVERCRDASIAPVRIAPAETQRPANDTGSAHCTHGQRLIRRETKLVSGNDLEDQRAAARAQMALAKSFVSHIVRARPICEAVHA
jgi:hypothetical protein